MPVEEDMVRQIFLLTDGAVSNTYKIVELIDEYAVETNSRIHTFGIGKDASKELIEEAAGAGCGSCSFIINTEEIEEQVIAALQKNYAPVRTIKKIDAVNKEDDTKPFELVDFYEQRRSMRNNHEFNLTLLLKEKVEKKYIRLHIYDPNSQTTELQIIKIQKHLNKTTFGTVIGSIAAKRAIDLIGKSLEVKQSVLRISKLYGVLSPYTSMITNIKLAALGKDAVSQPLQKKVLVDKFGRRQDDDYNDYFMKVKT